MEEKIYRPDELYFSVVDVSPYADLSLFVVFITPIEFFSNHQSLCYEFTSANIDPKDLEKAGLLKCELMESIFGTEDGSLTKENIHQNMLNAGFIFNEDFDKFANYKPE